jgi:hypothetical protein
MSQFATLEYSPWYRSLNRTQWSALASGLLYLGHPTLTVRMRLAFSPSAEEIETLVGLPGGTQIFRVHVHAPGVAIDLRCTQLDEFEELMIKARICTLTTDSNLVG